MKEGLTEIIMILDRSGSMRPRRQDVIGSINTFLAEQRAVPGEVRFTLVMFSSSGEQLKVYDCMNIRKIHINDSDYSPDGCTALLDAVASTIDEVGARLHNTPEDERPDKVLVCIITDGQENDSRKFNRRNVFDRIKLQTNTYNWKFIYLGANQDSFAEGASLGIQHAKNFYNTQVGVANMMRGVSAMTLGFRATGNINMDVDNTDEKKEK